MSTTSSLPQLYAQMPAPFKAGSRDVAYIRLRLSGTNTITTIRSYWSCVNADGGTNRIEVANQATVNGQWYTHVAYLGRQHQWRGKALGVRIIPVDQPNIMVELDDVRVCAPPAPEVQPVHPATMHPGAHQ
jgi:hypothetical protein